MIQTMSPVMTKSIQTERFSSESLLVLLALVLHGALGSISLPGSSSSLIDPSFKKDLSGIMISPLRLEEEIDLDTSPKAGYPNLFSSSIRTTSPSTQTSSIVPVPVPQMTTTPMTMMPTMMLMTVLLLVMLLLKQSMTPMLQSMMQPAQT